MEAATHPLTFTAIFGHKAGDGRLGSLLQEAEGTWTGTAQTRLDLGD